MRLHSRHMQPASYAYDLRKKVRVSLEKEALKKSKDGAKVEINFDLGEEPKEPLPVRYRTNDFNL